VKQFAFDASGATAIEYALVAGSISIVIVTVVTTLGTDVQALYQRLFDKM
jgi:pilus assembly protein Flp/PilA